MGIRFENGQMVMDDPDVKACPTDPMEALNCDSCQ